MTSTIEPPTLKAPATSADHVVAGLVDVDPAALAAALYQAGGTITARVAHATMTASTRLAFYPHAEVIAEADALLYEVLTWPIADTDARFPRPDDARLLAKNRRIPLDDAERIVDYLVATEKDACQALLRSGVEPIYTQRQAQVFTCLRAIAEAGQAPTRALVRAHATALARGSLRPGQGTEPVVYPRDPALNARVVSSHAAVHAILWLDQLDKTTRPTGLTNQRIDHLAHAQRSRGVANAVAHALRSTSAWLAPMDLERDYLLDPGVATLV